MATFAQFIQIGPYFVSGSQQSTIKVNHYIAGTTTLKDVYVDRSKVTAAAQPVVSDSNGIVSFYADGLYKLVVTYGADDTTLYTYDNLQITDTTTNFGEGAALTAASTLTLGTDGNYFHVTGSTTITALSGSHSAVTLTFDSTPALTHSSSLVLQYQENYTNVGGETFLFVNDGGGVWREVGRSFPTRASHAFQTNDANLLENLTLHATVSANVLTVAAKTDDGANCTSTDAGRIAFRSTTLTASGYNVRTVTGALNMSVSVGATLGFSANAYGRIWVLAIDNSGTVELAVYNSLVGMGTPGSLTFKPIKEDALVTTTAEGGAGAADSGQTLYSTTARSSKPCRLFGYVLIQTGATPGEWSSDPINVKTMGAGVSRPGDLMQLQRNVTGTVATGTTAMVEDDTTPQNTEGDQYMSQAITPTTAANLLRIRHQGQYAHTAADLIIGALFQDTTADALAAMAIDNTAASDMNQLDLEYTMQAGTTSATTFKVRVGGTTGATTTFNGSAGSQRFNGTTSSFLEVSEIFV